MISYSDGVRRVSAEWPVGQRTGHSLHEVPYFGCFKPQLAEWLIERYSKRGDMVYDPFMGRGTVPIQAALMGRLCSGSDRNPVSWVLMRPRLVPPDGLMGVADRLNQIDDTPTGMDMPYELLEFFTARTLATLVWYKSSLDPRRNIDRWIRMVILSRLTGHSPGYISRYTLPPNKCASLESQKKINAKHGPGENKDIRSIVISKTKSLLRDLTAEQREDLSTANTTVTERPDVVDLIVTSPPFLDAINYEQESTIRNWFIGAANSVRVYYRDETEWAHWLSAEMSNWYRKMRSGGVVCVEVGDVRGIALDTHVIAAGRSAGFTPECVIVDDRKFTKTSHIYGVENMRSGTNQNKVVVFRR